MEQLLITRIGKESTIQTQEIGVNINFTFLITFLRTFNYRVHQRLKKGKIADVKQLKAENSPINPKLTTDQSAYNSFIHCHSSEAHKIMPKDPEQAVRVLFHIYQQFGKCPCKAYYLNKIFNPELKKLQNSQEIDHYIFQMGKHKGRKDASKLQSIVQEMKSKFSSLRKACSSINCS